MVPDKVAHPISAVSTTRPRVHTVMDGGESVRTADLDGKDVGTSRNQAMVCELEGSLKSCNPRFHLSTIWRLDLSIILISCSQRQLH